MAAAGEEGGWGVRTVRRDEIRREHPREPRELFARYARKDGRTVAVLRALDFGDRCVVEAEVFPRGGQRAGAVRPGPYSFGDADEATQFVTETVQALLYLGCDVHSQ